jgi:carbon monoxide dehydrogenase subunit G
MKLKQSFEVAAPLERVWEALIDVERVAPCLPGATVTGRNDDGSYNGEFKVKIGPTSASYSGKLNMEKVVAEAHTATMDAAGTDKRGQGGAKATIVSSVADAGNGNTTVTVDTDYHITGRLARFGRGGMIEEISNRLLGEFSKNLQTMLAGGGEAPAAEAAEAAEAEPPTEPEPATDPDAAIEGATPVADQVGDRDPHASHSDPEPAPPANEPLDAGSLVGTALVSRIASNPAPLIALVVGFLVALRVLRRRG